MRFNCNIGYLIADNNSTESVCRMSSNEVLCCCEYENVQGEKSHLMACCCDCEALDQMADRCFKCEKIPTSLVDKFIDTLLDRCRLPGLLGGGASKLNIEIATPIIIIPASLMIAAIGPMTTCVVLTLLPYFCFFFYRTWKRKAKKSRTKFFFVWGLSSVLYMYLLFELVICRYTNISVFDNLKLSSAMLGMCLALMYAKKDPGLLGNNREKLSGHSEGKGERYSLDNVRAIEEGFEVIEHSELETVAVEKESELSSRIDTETWCGVCDVEKPARSGHCTVCDFCVRNRDHHCVWIDSCIGVDNHRSFLVAMVVFVVAGYYGSYVTICSVCDPIWPHDVTCGFHIAYRDYKWGVCYVGALYCILVTTMMVFGLVHQIILISQNLTSQELHTAMKQGRTWMWVFAKHNPHNRGLTLNWHDFVMKQRTHKAYETV